MKNNYWMKLWFDILRDPKMGMLPDRLWRRVIELFLIAGQHGEEGLLPDVSTIAWQLNKPVASINIDLAKIAEVGIVTEYEAGKWLVTNFKKRNEPVDQMKRIKDFRMRERYEKGNENETEMKRECNADVTGRYQEAEEQKNRRTEEEKIKPAAAFSGKNPDLYAAMESITPVTERIATAIDSAVNLYSAGWVRDAIVEATGKGKTFGYVNSILERWKREGRNGTKPTKYDATIQAGTYEAWSKRDAQ